MDEFDHALMEALNEAVPPAGFATNLADRLVARTRRRARFWKLLFALGLFSAAAGTVITATALSTGTMDVSSVAVVPTGTTGVSSVESTGTTGVSPVEADTPPPASSAINYQLSTLNSLQGATQVQNIILKKAATLMGAVALSAATPVRADGYQFIISGSPAANPSNSDVSSGTSLVVGMLASTSASAALEARTRTCDDSLGIALRSDEYRAMMIIFR